MYLLIFFISFPTSLELKVMIKIQRCAHSKFFIKITDFADFNILADFILILEFNGFILIL